LLKKALIKENVIETLIQTAVNAISSRNDSLEICNMFMEHPVFSQCFSDEQFVKIKNTLLDPYLYSNQARVQKNFEILSKVFEKTPVKSRDFYKFVECYFYCLLERKSDDNFQDRIFDLFIQKIPIHELLNFRSEGMKKLSQFPNELVGKIIDASIKQSEDASTETEEKIRVQMFNMLKCIIEKGSDHQVKNFLYKAATVLRLDKEQKESLLFHLAERKDNWELQDDTLEEILEILDIKSILKEESKKENLFKLSTVNSDRFLKYLLRQGYVDKIPPAIVKEMFEKKPDADMSSITRFLKESIDVKTLLAAMCAKHAAQIQARKQQEMGRFKPPLKPTTIISQFIIYQLSNINNSVGESIFQQLAEKIGTTMIEETIKTGLSVESAKKNKSFIQHQQATGAKQMLQKFEEKEDREGGERMLQEFERKKGLRVIGEAMEAMITNRSLIYINEFLAITKVPTLCASILEYYNVKKFSDLYEQPIYNFFRRHFEFKFKEFESEFDEAVTSLHQGSKPKA
jgi:hypothetical protein